MRVAREAARLLYIGASNEYMQAKKEAARNLGFNIMPSNSEIAIEIDIIADEQEGEERKQLLINMRKKSMDIMQPLQSPGYFYMMKMKDEKEPVYYGQSVGPDDTGAVLMRWKISEGQYSIIFGDLSTLDVTAEELAELEKPLLEQ